MKIYKLEKSLILIICFLAGCNSVYSQDCGASFNMVNPGSKLECIQGIHSPVNDSNPKYSTYIINHGFQFLTIILKEDKFDELIIGYEGFYDFKKYADNFGSYSVVDSFYVCDLKQDGPHYISFLEDHLKPNGWVTSLITQPEYFCDGGFIESSDRQLTMFEPVQYLPYIAYYYLKEQGRKNKRDYIKEFEIFNKLKKAKITSKRAYFHNEQDERTKRKDFVVIGDMVVIDSIAKDWLKVAYEGNNKTTQGWIRRSDLEILD